MIVQTEECTGIDDLTELSAVTFPNVFLQCNR